MEIDKRLKKVYEEADSILKECLPLSEGLRKDVEKVLVDSRKTSRNGICRFKDGKCTIEINEYMLKIPYEYLLRTMLHELLHTYVDSKGHGGMWKARTVTLYKKKGIIINRTNDYSELGVEYKKRPVKYEFRCKKCGQIITRTRRSRFTEHYERYVHNSCGGKFEKVV